MAPLYNPNHVANAFLLKAREEGVNDVDHLKIQKLIFNLNGFNLAIHDSPVIGEKFQAWKYGPVLESLYHQFKSNGSKPISRWAFDYSDNEDAPKAYRPSDSDKDFYDILNAVWDKYKKFNGLQLSALTHAAGTPWYKARRRKDDYLDDSEIKEHFKEILYKSRIS